MKKGLFSASAKSFSLGVKIAPKPFTGYALFSVAAGLLPLATIGSFSLLVNKVIEITKVKGQIYLGFFDVALLLLPYILILLAAYFLPYFVNSVTSYFANVFQERFTTGLSYLFAKNQMSLDAATLESSAHQNKIQQGNEWGRGSIVTMISRGMSIAANIVSLAVTVVILLAIDIRLGILAVFAGIPLYYIEQKYNRKLFVMRRLFTEHSRLMNNRRNIFQSQYSLIELNMFGSSRKFLEELKQLMDDLDNRIIPILKKKNIVQILFRIYSVLCSLIAAILLIQKGFAGSLPIGTLVLAFSAYNNFYGSVSNLFSDIALSQDATRYAHVWFDLLEAKPVIVSKPNALKPNFTTPPKIEFKNVSFMYPESDVFALRNIDLTITPGEKTAIVGLSGAGKTTLIRLLCRVYDPTEGEILIDGIPLCDLDLQYWHECLGVMFQNYGQYNVTIEESVALGRNGGIINSERVDWSLKMAGAETFVNELKNGKNQLLWKGFRDGTELSKGEHQRLAIARIFYREALISVLDEPTSSVDALTAEEIFKNLEEKMTGKTVILISHNFSTVKESSNIIVLEHGTIIEQGTHGYLYNKNGRYAELYESQANAFTA